MSSFFISEAEKKGSFFMDRKKQMNNLFRLTCLALLIAMEVVLARFASINLGVSIRFSFSFIPVVIAARQFGIIGSMAVFGLGDLIGAVAFPTTGAYMPGFTITAVVSGFIYGIFLYKKTDIVRIVLSVLTSQVVCSLLMNSYWIWLYYMSGSKTYSAVLLSRVPQSLVTTILEILFMALFLEKINKAISRLKR